MTLSQVTSDVRIGLSRISACHFDRPLLIRCNAAFLVPLRALVPDIFAKKNNFLAIKVPAFLKMKFFAWLAAQRESSFDDGSCKLSPIGAEKSAECCMLPVGSGMVPAVFRVRWTHMC